MAAREENVLLWEFRLPVTALALSARRPFGPARFARGLGKNFSFLESILGSEERVVVFGAA